MSWRCNYSSLTFRAMLAATVALTLAQNCFAQAQQQRTYVPKQNRAWGNATPTPVRKEQPAEYQATNMDREVSLPNLPAYTGKQVFMSGLSYPNAKEGPGYYMTYNTEHTESQVKDWWQNALRMDPWKITHTDASTIKAQGKDGSKCSIVVAGPVTSDKTKGMRASYSIFYHVVQKGR